MSDTVTLPAHEHALLQRALTLLNKMADDPQRGTDFKRMAKSVDPTLRFTDMETADRVQGPLVEKLTAAEARLAAIEAEREAEKASMAAEKQARTLTGEIDQAARRFGLTDDGRTLMTKRMQDKGNLDAEAAAAWVAAQAPKAQPSEVSGIGPSALDLFGSAEKSARWEKLHVNPVSWMDEEISAALAENPIAA